MAKNLRVFSSYTEYQNAELVRPAVSYIEETEAVYYDQVIPPVPKWFAYYDDENVESGVCDGTTAVTANEIPFEYGQGYPLFSVEIEDCVSAIGESAFSGCTTLSSVTISSGVTSIAYNSFRYCSGLTSIVIPNGVTSIGAWAFGGCRSLTSINIPSGVTTIENGVFFGCSSLTSIDIPSGVTEIENAALQGCSSLTSVTIPDSVTTIGNIAFRQCTSLTSIDIPSGVTSINDRAFVNCSSLSAITVEATTPPTLGTDALSGIDFNNLAIYVPASAVDTYKEDYMWGIFAPFIQAIPTFDGKWFATYDGGSTSSAECDSTSAITSGEITLTDLVSVEIGDCVTEIGNGAFDGANSLTSMTISNSVTTIGESALVGCGFSNITIPNSVTSIGNGAFMYCTSLTSITIPDSVTSINNDVFSSCGLISITIPSGITSIGDYAFNGCAFLQSITVEATTPPTLGSEAFDDTNDCIIYVPSASVNAYQSAWSDYSSRIQAIP